MDHKVALSRARPSPCILDLDHTALLVIDMQRDFLEFGGYGTALGNDVALLAQAVPSVRRLLAGFRTAGLPIIHTVEGHRSDLSDCPASKRNHGLPGLRVGDPGPFGRYLVLGEPGNAPIAACRPSSHEKVIEKPGKGAFYRTDLEEHLKASGLTTLVVCGVTAEVCVQTTLREAADRGFEVILATDATASYVQGFREIVAEMVVSQGGIVGWTTSTNEILFSVLRAKTWYDRVQWSELRPGLRKARLALDEDGWESAFLSYEPGAKAPRHRHTGTERVLILEGSQSDAFGDYKAGEAVENAAGTVHALESQTGCLLLIDWDAPVEFLDE